MSDRDAFEEEMGMEANNFLVALREQLPEQPDPRLEVDLVTRLAATARAESETVEVIPAARPRGRFGALRRAALPARIALASLGLVLSMAGLAVAGVSLPGSIDSGFREVGIDLPNQEAKGDGQPPTEPAGVDSSASPGGEGTLEQKPNGGERAREVAGKGIGKSKSRSAGPSGNGNGQQTSESPGSSPGRTKHDGPSPASESKNKPKPPKFKPKPAPRGNPYRKSN